MPRRVVNAAYNYFVRSTDDPTKHTCGACGVVVSSPKTASNLINHLKTFHKERYDAMLNEELERKKEEAKTAHEEASMKMDEYVYRTLYNWSHPKQV